MKNPTYFKIGLFAILLMMGMQSIAQNYIPFTSRFDQDLKGDIVLIGNNILGPDNNAFNDNDTYNHTVDMRYIDIDNDNSTFSSSSADLTIPNPNCYRIIYAGLYWGAVTNGPESITNVKFKGPEGGYNDIVGTVIYDNQGNATGNAFPYACYADVTDIVTGFGNDLGTYTIANVSSAQGRTADLEPFNGTGYSAGWSLFVVYEDPTLPGKSITSFDGFSAISSSVNLDIPVSGFRTVPAPTPVRANFAFAALEGDKPIRNDRLVLNGVPLSAADRDPGNFFNSSVTELSATPVNDRNPNSTNTLGFDTGVMVVPNPGNSVIANDATSATVRLESDQDVYFEYFFALAVDIIEPNIVLTKIVEDEEGNDIGGQEVGLGTPLNYVIGFQNTGNDNARGTIIRDVLPINIIFNYPEDIVSLPPGVTVQSYDPTTRELIFAVDDSVVEENDPVYEIRFRVTVVESCNLLQDACSNIINNQAFSTYQGTLNPNFTISDDPSFNSNTGCLLIPQATNFLADLNCTFSQEVILCGDSTTLTAGDGYDSYAWSTNPNGNPVIGTGQSITVTETDVYYSFNTAVAPCQSIVQVYDVKLFSGNVENPVIPFADQVVTCPNDGKLLPNIFLCGANDSRFIQTNITDSSSMIWEKLNEDSCDAVTNADCANEDDACTWNEVATGPDFLGDTAGQYRLTINYQGGCFNQFYFNIYENLLVPTVTSKDIICTTPGEIKVGGVPNGYEYSLDGNTYQASNTFVVTAPDIYTVYIRQVGIPTNPCVFTVPEVQIRERDFTASVIITQPYCNGDKGSVKLAANDARPQYFYAISSGGTLVNSVGPINDSDYTFDNLNTGTYSVTISTEDGCTHTQDVVIIEPPVLTVTAALTTPLTCTDGEITVYPQGGTPPYFYFVNSTTEFQSTPEITVTSAGVYDITVVDSNNCSASTTITVEETAGAEFTIDSSDILCSDTAPTGSITINVTNANGNNVKFSIDNGDTFVNSNVFTGLAAGSYDVVVRSKSGPDVCLSSPRTVTIAVQDSVTGTATLTAPYTCDSNGEITVSDVTGGTPPYSYSIDGVNFQNASVFSGLNAGTYNITIKDMSDCAFTTAPITIDPLNPPTDLSFESTEVDCTNTTSTVTITNTSGGVSPLEYQIISPAGFATAYQTSNAFVGLAPGTYTFQVMDANECTYSESFTIEAIGTITVIGQTTSDISCFNANDGSAEFTVQGTTNFTYSIDGGAAISGISPLTIENLSAGSHTISIVDSDTGCTATTSIAIDAPTETLASTVEVSPITCNATGSIIVTTTGGWGGVSYTLTLPDGSNLPVQSNSTFTSLSQLGTYTLITSDSRDCESTLTFEITGADAPTATIDTTSALCYNSETGASIAVTASGGQPPYEYSLNGSPFVSNNTFFDLIPGTYYVEVRDANGCTTSTATETITSELVINTVLTKALDCSVTPEASFAGTFSGGTAPYTYQVSFDGGAFTNLGTTTSPFSYTTTTAGNYQFQITDAKGCTVVSNVLAVDAITLPEIISVVQVNPIQCYGDSNASIDVTINTAVGTPTFVINVFNDSTGIDYGTQTSGLTSGSYTVTLTDANECTDTETIVITEPDPINVNFSVIDISCISGGTSKGSIIIDSVTGGTAPYTYYVTGTNSYSDSEVNATGTTSVTFDVVDFGLYQINVIDANGCSVLIQDVKVASPPNDLDININSTVNCLNGGSAEVVINTALAGSGPFYFAIYTGPSMVYDGSAQWLPENPAGSKKADFSNLIPGVTYTFIVYDDNSGCYYYETSQVPVPTNSTLSASAVVANNITCTGNADGTVNFSINSVYTTDVTVQYEIYNSLSLVSTGVTGTAVVPAGGSFNVLDLGPLPFGNYIIVIEETSGVNLGCSIVSVPFNITESTIALNIDAELIKNANCNPNSGIITATASDGTAPYLYQITSSATPPGTNDTNWASNNTFNVDANTYYVHALDAYGCIVTTSIDVPMDPEAVIAAVVSNQCVGTEGAYAVEVSLSTSGVAPHAFSIDGGAFQTRTTPFMISDLSSGTHSIEVRDANGCGNVTNITVEIPLDVFANVDTLPSCTNNDGAITVNATGGTGIYNYDISPSVGSISLSGNVFSGVPSGSYTITVTDANSSCTTTADITLEAATPVSFTTTVDDATCNGNSDGSIVVTLPDSNDNPPYTYEITAPIIVPSQSNNIFNGLAADTYTILVTSSRGCTMSMDVPVGEPNLLEVSATATSFTCQPDNSFDSSILTVLATGGTAPFSYSINGTSYVSSNTFDIADTGSIQNLTVFVKDANGCIASENMSLDPLQKITSAAFTTASPIDCNGNGSITISATGGSGNYSYQMLPDGASQSSNVFPISEPGDYYFQVNDLDTGCYFVTTSYTVLPFDQMEIAAVAIDGIDCYSDTDGSLEFSVSGYTGDYQYEILDASGTPLGSVVSANTSTNPQIVSGLAAGSYKVSIIQTNSPFCQAMSNSITIEAPASPLTLIANETASVTCTNGEGTITATAVGGWGSYEYELTGASTVAYSTNGTFTNLSAGSYTVNVKDIQGCIASSSVTLAIPPIISADVTASSNTLSCFGDSNASITVSNVNGGQGSNYSYTLNRISPTVSSSGPQTNPVFNNLSAGVYEIVVTDGYNCEFSSPTIEITEPTMMQADLVKASSQTCTTETRLTLSATGGTGPYEYSANANFTTVLGNFASSTSFTVAPGTYAYYVRDANACIAIVSNEIQIDALPSLVINLDATNAVINCAGEETGVIVAVAEGGLGNYVYTLQDSAGNDINATQDSPGVFTNLAVGTYQVSVESGDCLSNSATISISEPNAPMEVSFDVTNVTCSGTEDGRLEISATGGNGIIKYAISPQLNQFFDSPVFEDLSPGDYSVIVQDELGCYVTFEFTITDPQPVIITIIPNSLIPEVCSGDANGEFSIEISGGNLPYSVSLDDYEGTYTTGTDTQTVFDFTNLPGGDHTVFVRDALGCESEWNITFPEAVLINPEIEIVFECENNNLTNTVTVTTDDSVDPADLDYSLNGGAFQISNVFRDVPPGIGHYIEVRHTNGCIQSTLPFDIDDYQQLALVLTEVEVNEIVATATGGSGTYEFFLNGESQGSNNRFYIYESGDYTVTVVDANGCSVELTQYFEYIDICIPNYFTPNGDGQNDTWGPGCAQNYRNLSFDIFDRYGRKVAEYGYGETWDGKYNQNELPMGDYWYIVKLNEADDDREFVGHFTLYR